MSLVADCRATAIKKNKRASRRGKAFARPGDGQTPGVQGGGGVFDSEQSLNWCVQPAALHIRSLPTKTFHTTIDTKRRVWCWRRETRGADAIQPSRTAAHGRLVQRQVGISTKGPVKKSREAPARRSLYIHATVGMHFGAASVAAFVPHSVAHTAA